MKNTISIILLFSGLLLTSACGMYSFTGASIDPEAKTISVDYISNKAATIQPTLSQVFTERLKDIFIEQTNLNLVDEGGDLAFSGYISQYKIKPIAIQANETAGKNRLTIVVKITFKNSYTKENNFEQTFSRYRDFNSTENISTIEQSLIEEITNELTEDIFNKAVVNW